MFGVLTLERDPLKLSDILSFRSLGNFLTSGLVTWVQVAGGVAALCLLFWLPFRLIRGTKTLPARNWMPAVFNTLVGLALLGYLGLLVLHLGDILAAIAGEQPELSPATKLWSKVFLSFAGFC